MYVLAGLCILVSILLGILPLWTLLMLLILFKLIPNIKTFRARQIKSETFHLQIDNLMLFNGALALSLFLALLFD